MKATIRSHALGFSAFHILALCFLLLSRLSAAGAEDVAPIQNKAAKISIRRGVEQVAVFVIETASDRKTKQRGLSGRSQMPADQGMLFILDSKDENYFWMKDMEFPIDILFFTKDKSLTEVLPKLRPCKVCPTYKAPAHTAYALEINAGLAEALGIRKGDRFVNENK